MPAPRFVLDDFWPSDLFLGGIPGAWYDPTDLSTMFQDSTGTTPVTAVEQPVGLILDKSQGLALGSELVTNGDFSAGTTGWTGTNVTLSIENGMLKAVSNAAGSAVVAQNATLPLTGRVLSRYYVQPPAGRSVAVFVRNNAAQSAITTTGVYQSVVQPAGTTEAIAFLWTAAAAGEIAYFDDITVRTIAGNHASQSTAASRPTYRARYNLLTYSEDFGNAAWSKTTIPCTITVDQTTAPDGTNTADLMTASATAFSGVLRVDARVSAVVTYTASCYFKAGNVTIGRLTLATSTLTNGIGCDFTLTGAGAAGVPATFGAGWVAGAATITSVGNGWYRCTLTGTAPATTDLTTVVGHRGACSAGDTLFIWGAQVLTAADVTATGNAYQRIAAATVYDTAPIFRPYLAFDGLDDSLSTAAINFTATDKMSVFFGLSKLSDAPFGCALELSTSAPSSAGAFLTFARGSTFATGFDQGYGGTVWNGAPGVNAPAPTTRVFSQLYNIAQPSAIIRGNGAQVYADNITAGGGTFGNYPLFIGRRNNASFPFNGRIYELIVRGAASSTTEIIDTETWVNARTGGY